MTRYVKTQITQLSSNESAALQQINKNLDDIQSAIQDTVSRSGQSPTQMTDDLDMNGKRLINVPAPLTDNDLVRRKDVVEDIATVQSLVNTASTAAGQAIAAAEGVQEAIADANVGIVADDLMLGDDSKIRIAANNIDDISACVSDIESIKDVGDNISNVNAVADNETNINAVAGNKTNIDAVADNESNINTVAENLSDVSEVANISQSVSSVADNETNINKVSDDLNNIDAVASELPDVKTKANKSLDNLDSTGQAIIDGKLDLNLGNITNISKETIVGWGMPDYSAAVSISLPYTPIKDGYILRNVQDGYIHLQLTQNLVSYAGTGGRYNSTMIPVYSGQTMTNVSAGGTYNIYFIPCKGV